MKLPELYIKFLADKIAPLSSNAAQQALKDLEQWQSYLKKLPTQGGITAMAQRHYDDMMNSRIGKSRLETHCNIIEEKTSEMIKVLRVSEAVAKQGYRGLRGILRNAFPNKTKWLDDELEFDMTQTEIRKCKDAMTPLINAVLKMNNISDKRRKHVLFDLEMLGLDDYTQQLELDVTALKAPVERDDGTKLFYRVHIDFMGYTYTLLKSEMDFKRLIERFAVTFLNPFVVIPPEKHGFSFGSFTKSKEQRNAKHYAIFLQTMSEKLCIPQFWRLVECQTPEFRAHVIGRDDDTTNESWPKRQVMVDYRVHVTHNNVFRFAHILRSRFMRLHKRLEDHAKKTGLKRGSIPPLKMLERR